MVNSLRGRFGLSTLARAEGPVASPLSKVLLRVRRYEKGTEFKLGLYARTCVLDKHVCV